MYARVINIYIKPGSMDEGINIYENAIVPAMRQQPGFKGTTLLTNRDANTGISISLWETEADMQAGEASGYLQEQLGKAAKLFSAPPTNAHYEVSVQA